MFKLIISSKKRTNQIPFPELSVSDGVVNVYKALQAAEQMSKK